MVKFYSQHGEDYILWQLFKNQPKGYYLEIGALDGLRFSNTYMLEEFGWDGICVEAHPDFIEILKTNRPKSICVHAAAGNMDGQITLSSNKRGSLSTLNTELKERFARDYSAYFYGYEDREVPSITLNSLLSQEKAPTAIDVISIDVEGWEEQVLQGLDFERYKVRIFIIEAVDQDFDDKLSRFMQSKQYIRARNFYGNLFFCRSEEDAEIVRTIDVNCTLNHKPHPLDTDAQETFVTVIHSKLQRPRSGWSLKRIIKRSKKQIRKLIRFAKGDPAKRREINATFQEGFHGDQFLLKFVDGLLKQAENFIETGTNVGTTALYVAKNYPELAIYSCEPDNQVYAHSKKLLAPFPQAKIYNQLSPQFLYDLHSEKAELFEAVNFFWLDAHDYGFQWPLHDEIAFISQSYNSGIIAIDDAQVPRHPEFAFMSDNGQVCDRDYVVNALAAGKKYCLIFPDYTEHTSAHHPLVGVIFVLFGTVQVPQVEAFQAEVIER